MSTHHGVSDARCQARGFPPLAGTSERHAPDRVLDVAHVALDVSIDLAAKSIRGTVRHDVSVVPPELPAFAFDAVGLTIETVSADGQSVPFSHDGERLVVRPREPWKRGEAHAVLVTYRGRPERGLYFIAPDETYPDKPLQAWTQGQDEDARFWFPCIDHPSQKSTTEIRVRVPKGFDAISNGRLESRQDRGEETEFHWVQEAPHVTYLVCLVVGRFGVVREKAGGTELRYLVPPGSEGDAERTFGRTPRMLGLFEEMFGHPYPYAKYDQIVVSDFTAGGMENTSATVLYEYTMLDATVEGAIDRDDLIAHELAHQWFGDLLTCRDWSHAWLNEGFATYSELLWYEHGESRDRGAYQLLDCARRYFEEAREDYSRPIVTRFFTAPVDIFDRHLYEKGACVLHHLRLELGDDPFFRALRRYVSTHAGGLVETHDLRRAFEKESGRNLEPFFDQWIFRAGHPEVEVSQTWDERVRRLTLGLRQTQKDARDKPWRFPARCRAWFPAASRGFVDRTFEVTEAEHTFVWDLPDDPAGVRIGLGGLPLVRLKFPRPDAWLERQLQADDDLLGRIEAAEQLGKSGTTRAVAALATALGRERTWMGQVEIARALGLARGDAARDALAERLSLASPRARGAVAASLGRFREDPAAAAALERLLERERAPLVRAAAFRALGAMRALSARPVLTKGLWEPSWHDAIGRACIEGLGALRDPTLVPLFVNALRRGEHELRRIAAIDALRETAQVMETRTAVREELQALLDDPSLRVVQASIRALRSLDDHDAVPALERVASKRYADPRVRLQARGAIKALLDDRAKLGAAAVLDRVDEAEAELRKLRDRLSALERPAAANTRKPARMGRKIKRKRRR